MDNKLKLPVGIENFEEIRKSGFYYIDKTYRAAFAKLGKGKFVHTSETFWKNS